MSYQDYERAQGWDEEAFGTYTPAQAAYFAAEIGALPLPADGGVLRVLDVGFGNGSFIAWCRDRGWACAGVEVNDRLVGRAQAKGFVAAGDVPSAAALSGPGPFDLVTALDVLEHVDRDALVPFLAGLRQVCGPQSLILLRFPNGDNPFSAPVQNGDVTHRTAIGRAMLRQVADLSGLDVVMLDTPKIVLSDTGLARRLLVAAGVPVRWVIGQVLRHLFMGGMEVSFAGNLLAVLRRRSA